MPNWDIPRDHVFMSVAYSQAAKYKLKYILSGHNIASESILPKSWGYNAGDVSHVKGIQREFGSVKLRTYPTLGLVKRYLWYEKMRGIRMVWPLNYRPYVYSEGKKVITEEVDWRDYGGKHHESVFTRYFQGYYLPTKFGFDKRRAHLSSLILSDQITRDEALAELEKLTYDPKLQRQDHEFIAKKLGLTVSEFDEICRRPPKDHLEYPNRQWLWTLASKLIGGTRCSLTSAKGEG